MGVVCILGVVLCGGPCVQLGYTDVFILGCFVCIHTEVCRCVYRLKPVLHACMVGLCALGEVSCMRCPVWGPFCGVGTQVSVCLGIVCIFTWHPVCIECVPQNCGLCVQIGGSGHYMCVQGPCTVWGL